jgi:hypothetical protein
MIAREQLFLQVEIVSEDGRWDGVDKQSAISNHFWRESGDEARELFLASYEKGTA